MLDFTHAPLPQYAQAAVSFRADASGLQVPEEKARTLPLSDDDRPDAAADMGVDDAQSLDRLRRTQPEVRYPARQVSADAFHAGSEGPPPIRRRHFPHFRPLKRPSSGAKDRRKTG